LTLTVLPRAGAVGLPSRASICWSGAAANLTGTGGLMHQRRTLRHAGGDENQDVRVHQGVDNRKCLHSTLGDTSPVQFLKDWISTRQGEKQVA
jgi:hypothetical protein